MDNMNFLTSQKIRAQGLWEFHSLVVYCINLQVSLICFLEEGCTFKASFLSFLLVWSRWSYSLFCRWFNLNSNWSMTILVNNLVQSLATNFTLAVILLAFMHLSFFARKPLELKLPNKHYQIAIIFQYFTSVGRAKVLNFCSSKPYQQEHADPLLKWAWWDWILGHENPACLGTKYGLWANDCSDPNCLWKYWVTV